jgi:dienelactone hydrolase
MKRHIRVYGFIIMIIFGSSFSALMAQNSNHMLKEETVMYTGDGTLLKGYIVYDQNQKGKRPAVLVVHEWWGLNDYAKMRARKLAESGYIAMAVDIFGDGITAANPQEAQDLTKPFYQNPGLAKARLDAAIKKIKEYAETDPSNVAAIGYCFGGSVVLNSAKLGSDLKGIVSFHGGLAGVPADKNLLKAKILVCHGGNDKFISQKDIDTFRNQLDSIGANYSFKVYPNATHAFTNPDATKTGKEFNMPIEYNAEADKNSWNDMTVFFNSLFKPDSMK